MILWLLRLLTELRVKEIEASCFCRAAKGGSRSLIYYRKGRDVSGRHCQENLVADQTGLTCVEVFSASSCSCPNA
jgi:hypothetical protein